jgi:glycosyltransferase involved in cell wall biosynthesis
VQFRILGKGEEEQNCRKLAHELGCSNVVFVGHLPSAQVGEEMRKANIFFFPSVIEGHPQVLGQAAACGLPAVAMDIYRPEYVIDGKTGFLVNSDAELSEKLAQLIVQHELRALMREAAIAHAQKFDWDKITLQWQQAFEEAVEKRRQRR